MTGGVILMLVSVLISAVSQVLLKKSALKEYGSHTAEYLNPLVISAYAIFVISTFLTVLAYRTVPLSMGPILEATGYIYVTLFGVLIFHEKINKRKIIALVMIIAGIAVFSI
ncbi:MAG: EamA family transporter [Lachnospiraceae bacterium]|nr:EamA family transporter [Lachnospiraceae bacterium]